MIMPGDFLKWCSIFGIPVGGSAPGGNNTFLGFASPLILPSAVANQTLFTVASPSFNFFIPTTLIITAQLATTVTTPPTLSVGSNSTAFDSLLGQTSLSMLTSTSAVFEVPFNTAAAIPCNSAGTVITTKISIAAVATALALQFMLIGNGVIL